MKYFLQIKIFLLVAITLISINLFAQEDCDNYDCDLIQLGYRNIWLAWKAKIQSKINDGSIQWSQGHPYYCVNASDACLLVSAPSNVVFNHNIPPQTSIMLDMFSLNGTFGQYHTLGYRGDTRSPYEIISAGGFFPDQTIPFYTNSMCSHFISDGNPRSIISTSPNWRVAEMYGSTDAAAVRIMDECCPDGTYNGCSYVTGQIAGCIVEFRYPCETYSLIKPTFFDAPYSEIDVGYIPLDHITCFVPVYFGYRTDMENHDKISGFNCDGLPEYYWVSWSYRSSAIQWNNAYRGDDNWDPTPYDGKKFPTLARPPSPELPGLPATQIIPAPWGVLSLY